MKTLLSSVSIVALLSVSMLAVGCAAESGDAADTAGAEVTAGAVTPGKIRLFAEPNHVTNPECESFTDLELKPGSAHLVGGLGGKCSLVALYDGNPRDYTLRVKDGACGIKVYEGSRRVPISPAATGLATIKITDQRNTTCAPGTPHLADVVVEETQPGFPGSITTTMYSKDDEPTQHLVIFCREQVDHGAEVNFYAAGPEGKIVRAEYKETTFAETTTVANMSVCVEPPREPKVDPIPDMLYHVSTCNTGTARSGYVSELFAGGIAGLPQVKLYRVEGGERTLVHGLMCKVLAP
jgi:hypothetical protein